MTSTLLVANDGGHIMQLRSLVDRFVEVEGRTWVTVATPQTESLLAGERVCWVGEAPTRDWRAVARNAVQIRKVFRSEPIERAISTGSSLAISALPQAALRRIPTHYIESVTRTDGYSVSGRILQRVPGIAMYVQWPHLATGRWQYSGSVLDGYAFEAAPDSSVRSVVVSVGTSGKYGFRRLVERLRMVIPADVEVLWQTGSTDVSGLGIEVRASLPARDLEAAIERADVVVAHAGAGIALTALQGGKIPLLAPRLAVRGEHIDDHQGQIARNLSRLGLAVVAEADEITWELLTSMTRRRAVAAAAPERFRLREIGGSSRESDRSGW